MRKSFEITFLPRFDKSFMKLSEELSGKFMGFLYEFEKDPFSPKFKTNKLQGPLREYYALRISYSCRAIFRIEGSKITFIDIGGHDIYKTN